MVWFCESLSARSAWRFVLAYGLSGCALVVGDYGVDGGSSGGAGKGGGGANVGGGSGACDTSPPENIGFRSGYGEKAGFVRADVVALDANDNTLIAGPILGSAVAFGKDTLTKSELPNQGGFFVASVRPDGNAELVRAFDTGGDPVAITLGGIGAHDDAVSGEQAIYFSGQYEGSLTIGDFSLQSAGYTDSFVARLSRTGEPVWARSLGDATFQQPPRFAFDKDGDLLVVMRGEGSFSLGGTCGTPPYDGAGLWTFKLRASDGECVWLVKHPVGWSNNALGFAYDPQRDVAYVGSETGGDPYFSSVPGRNEGFVYAFRPNDGSPVWPTAARFGPVVPEAMGTGRWIATLAVSPCGELYAAGQFEKNIAFGAVASLQNELFDEGASSQVFLAKLSPDDGTPLWVAQFPHRGKQLAHGLAVGPHGLLALVGEAFDLSGSPGLDFGAGPMPQDGDNPTASDAFVAIFKDGGSAPQLLFAQRLADHGANTWSQRVNGAAFERGGALRVGGTFENSIQFSPQVGDSVDGFSYGVFVLSYGPP